jgi:hypothetical protein
MLLALRSMWEQVPIVRKPSHTRRLLLAMNLPQDTEEHFRLEEVPTSVMDHYVGCDIKTDLRP